MLKKLQIIQIPMEISIFATKFNFVIMKKSVLYIAVCTALMMTACRNTGVSHSTGDGLTQGTNEDSVQVDSTVSEPETTYFPAINRYLVDSIGSHYAKGEFCVPMPSVVAVDERNDEDILVWGDFWVMNYNQVGDTLKTVSGGSHPGLMHIRQTEKGFEVTRFDGVADGSLFLKTAKQIFGDKFDAFQAIQSDADKRKRHQEVLLTNYVKEHGLTAKMYQDYGWPAVSLK